MVPSPKKLTRDRDGSADERTSRRIRWFCAKGVDHHGPTERVEVELYGREGKVAVVRVPQRRFPALLIQGDSLAILAGDARKLATAIRDSVDCYELADDLAQQLAEPLAYYASTLAAHGVPLPYNAESPGAD